MLPDRPPPGGAAGRAAGCEAPERPAVGDGATASVAASTPLPLADGELDEHDLAEFAALKHQIEVAANFRCSGYKDKCLRRRLAVRMRARGVHAYAQYARVLGSDEAEYQRLVKTLTVNVSKFFRNPELWTALERLVLPELYAASSPSIRIWSAGAASGEEPYSMAILAYEHAARYGHDRSRVSILGTDIDGDSLAHAHRAEYTDFVMTDIDPAVRDRWFHHDGTYRLKPEARDGVRFAMLDLMQDDFPANQHVIFCRNVIIYFERAVQEELFHRFHEALVPGGFLVLGKVEALFGGPARLFQAVASRERVFRRR
jgi:chemotaxis protein methyltransferase CheR